jgi:hypothetical protein
MTAAELLALAERVEGLTEADREVDILVAIALAAVPEGKSWRVPSLTASLDAVVSLIEQVLPGAIWLVSSVNRANIRSPDRSVFFANATSPARALLASLLRAKAAEVAG